MILSHIIGGLGNQMFQYAAARALSLANDVPLRLDVRDFAGYRLHQGFELSRVFVCNPEIATDEDVRDLLGWRASWFARKILTRPGFAVLRGSRLVVEPQFNYWPDIRLVSHNTYLVGYWQSEKYFSDASECIREDFVFRQSFSGQNVEIARKIDKTTAVSLHVRRGDYISHAKTNAVLGLCSLSYYREAIMHIAERVENPEFFIFSDDIAWVKECLEIDFPCNYVDHNQGSESYNDMHLMSLCRHHIIANSSFSWWGAWLGSNIDKIIIAPRNWFATGKDVKDLYPDGCVII